MIHSRTFALFDERRDAFAGVRNSRVLVYWPHGLGDFVHFGSVVPALEPSNTYFITRFGDDFVHLFDRARGITPLYSGVRTIGDGSTQGARHLGIEWKKIRNGPAQVTVPEPLASRIAQAQIDTVLYTDYPEPEGRNAFPFQTKARALIRKLVSRERLASLPLERPLETSLTFDVPDASRRSIEARLATIVAPGDHLYLLGAGGHTTPAKSWPQAEVKRFVRELSRFDSRSRVVMLDEVTMSKLFGELELPFAHVLVTLISLARATIGVSAGPLHAAMAMRVAPVLGIWLAHHPDWYDEFYADSLHLTGPLVHRKRLDRRPATLTTPPQLRLKTRAFPDRIPRADDALIALEELLR